MQDHVGLSTPLKQQSMGGVFVVLFGTVFFAPFSQGKTEQFMELRISLRCKLCSDKGAVDARNHRESRK